ncbi:hypothetical protein KC19_7G072700 [Ceratodon purpureus]|uniref:Uncharacterized protein n=1 Tax=Ceratodon purpureus TaxID=3225 RepID=A0A8T0HBT0_CERPU|nr:hypothetical protein KC19_7G072700 [Ceratodon purpureus]
MARLAIDLHVPCHLVRKPTILPSEFVGMQCFGFRPSAWDATVSLKKAGSYER